MTATRMDTLGATAPGVQSTQLHDAVDRLLGAWDTLAVELSRGMDGGKRSPRRVQTGVGRRSGRYNRCEPARDKSTEEGRRVMVAPQRFDWVSLGGGTMGMVNAGRLVAVLYSTPAAVDQWDDGEPIVESPGFTLVCVDQPYGHFRVAEGTECSWEDACPAAERFYTERGGE